MTNPIPWPVKVLLVFTPFMVISLIFNLPVLLFLLWFGMLSTWLIGIFIEGNPK